MRSRMDRKSSILSHFNPPVAGETGAAFSSCSTSLRGNLNSSVSDKKYSFLFPSRSLEWRLCVGNGRLRALLKVASLALDGRYCFFSLVGFSL